MCKNKLYNSRLANSGVELFWFVPSMGDEQRLGDPTSAAAPTIEHLAHVAQTAERAGFGAMLVPTGEMCHDAWITAACLAQRTTTMKFLVAFRPGFVSPPVAARMASSLDWMSNGRVLLNVVTGGHPHELEKDGDVGVDHDARYRRTAEFLDVVKRSWAETGWEHDGEFFNVRNGGIAQRGPQQPHPPIYLGGASEAAMRTAAQYADVYLMWGEPVQNMAPRAAQAVALAKAEFGRALKVGTRFQVVCRPTDAQARADAELLVAHISDDYRDRIRSHADRTDSVGQSRQNELLGDSEWLSDCLWNGFARARMGASVALVGSPETIRTELQKFVDAGIDTFILSGYPHDAEATNCTELVRLATQCW